MRISSINFCQFLTGKTKNDCKVILCTDPWDSAYLLFLLLEGLLIQQLFAPTLFRLGSREGLSQKCRLLIRLKVDLGKNGFFKT